MRETAIEELQKEVCKINYAGFLSSPFGSIIGISENACENALPIHGFRHPQEGNTTGWYVYSGDTLSASPDFFKPLHVSHLSNRCPRIFKYLGLPPGWRFFVADGFEDIWFDPSLLEI